MQISGLRKAPVDGFCQLEVVRCRRIDDNIGLSRGSLDLCEVLVTRLIYVSASKAGKHLIV